MNQVTKLSMKNKRIIVVYIIYTIKSAAKNDSF